MLVIADFAARDNRKIIAEMELRVQGRWELEGSRYQVGMICSQRHCAWDGPSKIVHIPWSPTSGVSSPAILSSVLRVGVGWKMCCRPSATPSARCCRDSIVKDGRATAARRVRLGKWVIVLIEMM